MAVGHKSPYLAFSLLVYVIVISLQPTSSATLNYAGAVKAGTTPSPDPAGSSDVPVRAQVAQVAHAAPPTYARSNSTQSQSSGRGGYCQINIKRNEELPRIQPLILHPTKSEFLYPTTTQAVRIDSSDSVRLVCPGANNVFSLSKGATQQLNTLAPECVRRNLFNAREIQESPVTIRDLGCDKEFTATAHPTGQTCLGNKFSRIQLGFELPKRPQNEFIPTLDVCFDQANYDAVYSTVKLAPSIQHRQWETTRPEDFAASSFYGQIGILQVYTRPKQREAFSTLLGTRQLAEKYLPRNPPDTKYFLARGHLAAYTDFVYGAEQRSTYFYMNVAPQWQIFNDGNWKDTEISVRNFAAQRTSELVVYTGTWGNCKLEDKNGKLQPMYLYVDTRNNKRGVKVPGYFWKAVYDPVTQEGVAIVGINNPFLQRADDQVFCTDICSDFKWLQIDPHNITKGYTFCCSMEEFRRTVKNVPEFPVKSTFTPDSKNCKTYDGCNRPLRNRPHGHGG